MLVDLGFVQCSRCVLPSNHSAHTILDNIGLQVDSGVWCASLGFMKLGLTMAFTRAIVEIHPFMRIFIALASLAVATASVPTVVPCGGIVLPPAGRYARSEILYLLITPPQQCGHV